MKERLLTITEVAQMLNVTNARAYQLARENIIPVVHLGRQLRIDKERLCSWIESGGQALPGGWRKEA